MRRRRNQRPDTFQGSQNLVPSYEIVLLHRLRKGAFEELESIHLASFERHEIRFDILVQNTGTGDEIDNQEGRPFPGKVPVSVSQEDQEFKFLHLHANTRGTVAQSLTNFESRALGFLVFNTSFRETVGSRIKYRAPHAS